MRRTSALLAFGVLSLVLPTGCKKPASQAEAVEKPTGAVPAKPASAPPATKPLRTAREVLAADFQAEVPLSHSAARIETAAGPPGTRTAHALVVLGRVKATLNGKVVAKMRCVHRGRPCTPAQRTTAAAQTAIDIDPGELEAIDGDVLMRRLRGAAAALKGTPVAVVADSRVRHSALMRTVATLRHVGARPLLAAVNAAGDVVITAPQLDGSNNLPRRRIKGAMGLPEAVARIELRLVAGQLSTALLPVVARGEATGGTARDALRGAMLNVLFGDSRAAVAVWADRMAAVYPSNRTVYLVVDQDVPYSDIVPLIDNLRDRCAPASTAAVCNHRARRFSDVRLAIASDEMRKAALGHALEDQVNDAPIPLAPPNAISAEMLRGIGLERARLQPPTPIPHHLLQPGMVPPTILHGMPSANVPAPPNVGGPPSGR